MGRKALSKDKRKLRAQMIKLRDSGLLPPKYAQIVLDNLKAKKIADDTWDLNKIYAVSNGRNTNRDIVDELLKLAEDNKLKEQIRRAEKLLEFDMNSEGYK